MMMRQSNNTLDSIGHIAAGFIKLYPNPTNAGQSIRVQYSFAKEGNSQVRLYNLMGQTIFTSQQSCAAKDNICTFDIETATLASGMYMLQVSNGAESFKEKVIITN